MLDRKLSADRIFDGYRFLDNQALILSAEGRVIDILPREEAGENLEVFEGILAPGLVNCHCHLELSHMRGRIPEGTGLVDFVFKVVTERHFSEDEILAAIAAGEEEMLRNGIVGVGDISNNTLSFSQKTQGHLRYHNFIEVSGWLPAVAVARFQRAQQLSHQLEDAGLSFSLVPHAPYSVSNELWKLLGPCFKNKVVSIHNQETPQENEFFRHGTGELLRMYQLMGIDNSHHRPTNRNSLPSYFANLSEAAQVLLVHNTFTTEQDLEWLSEISKTGLAASRIFFCLCPNANLYIEKTLPDIEVLRQHDCQIVLGTDSLASNWSLSILDEMNTIRKKFPSVPLEELLTWVTSNGAKALQMDKDLGSFERGKQPGVILINNDISKVSRVL